MIVLLALDSVNLYHHLEGAKNSLIAAQDQLAAGNLQTAAVEFQAAQANLDNADATLEGHKITLGFARIVPVLGSQIRAADGFVAAGAHLAEAGLLFTQAATGIPGLDASATGHLDVGQMADILVKFGNDLAPVQTALDRASEANRKISASWLVGPVSRIKQEIDERLSKVAEDVTAARKLIATLPEILGEPGAAPNHYLLLQENCFELRPAGGFISSYGILETTHSSLALPEYQRSSQGLPKGIMLGTDAPYPWGDINPTFQFWDAGWWPDFPMSVDMLSKIWALNGKAPVQGYIAFDPIAIQYGLEKLGPMLLPEYNETVTADDLMQMISSHATSTEAKEDFVKSLGHNFFSRVVTADPREWFALGQGLMKALTEKHLQLYFTDPATEQPFADMDWSGEIHDTRGDYLLAADGNLGVSTLGYEPNYYARAAMEVEIIRQEDGTLRHLVRYTVDNTAGFYEYWSFLRVFIPADAVAPHDDAILQFGLEAGKQVLGRSVFVKPGEKDTFEFAYTTPAYDTLLLEKQAGQRTLPVSLLLRNGGSGEEIMLANEAELPLR